MCVIAVAGLAPCQCFSLGANQITSPGRISPTSPPQLCAHPSPNVTINVWPNGCICQAVRAPGSNVTLAPRTRAGSGASNIGSIRTFPVNQSVGPSPDFRASALFISMYYFDRLLVTGHTPLVTCLRFSCINVRLPNFRGGFVARGCEEALPRFRLVPDGREFPHTERRLMHSVARPEGEIGHGVAILVDERLPNFVVPAPGVDDQEIKIFSAPVQNDKAKSLRFQWRARKKRTGQPIDLIRYLSIFRREFVPLQHRAV